MYVKKPHYLHLKYLRWKKLFTIMQLGKLVLAVEPHGFVPSDFHEEIS